MKKVLLVVGLVVLFFAQSSYADEFKLVCDDSYFYNPITNDGVNMEDHTMDARDQAILEELKDIKFNTRSRL